MAHPHDPGHTALAIDLSRIRHDLAKPGRGPKARGAKGLRGA